MTAQSNALIPFNFNSIDVRAINKDGEVWFVAADVCKALELSNPTKALQRLDADEQALTSIQGLNKGNDSINIVNESGLYSLILGSRKAEARQFKKWVTSEVIPTIRKTGSYNLTISPKQQYLLKEAASIKAAASRKTHQAVWREFYQAFEIPKYQDLPASQFDEALAFLNGKKLQKQPQIENNQEQIAQAFAIASEVGNKVSRTVFETIMAGDNEWQYHRWLFAMNHDQDGSLNPQVRPIKHNALIAPLAELPRYILDSGLNVSNKELANLATACSQRLAERMTLEASEERTLAVG